MTSTRSPAIAATPSIVCVPESVMSDVVATRTDALTVRPCAMASTYAFVAASCAEVGSARPVIFLPPSATLPEKVVVAAVSVPTTESALLKVPDPLIVRSPVPLMAEPTMDEKVPTPPVMEDAPILILPKPEPSEPVVSAPTVVSDVWPT